MMPSSKRWNTPLFVLVTLCTVAGCGEKTATTTTDEPEEKASGSAVATEASEGKSTPTEITEAQAKENATAKRGATTPAGTEQPGVREKTEKPVANETSQPKPESGGPGVAAATKKTAAETAAKPADEKANGGKEKKLSLEELLKAPSDVSAAPKEANETPSGLASRVIKPGKGKRKPKATDSVQVHYTGWQTTGRMFDSSIKRGEPATFPLNRVIAGWTEGVQLMVEGEKRRFWIPEDLAYKGRPGAPSGMLVFDVELLQIIDVPVAPPDVSEPPRDSDKLESGLATKILRPGTGDAKPKATSTVVVHYTGWTTDGQMFDSSVARGAPATFPLNRVIPGWTAGVGLMVVGEKRRLWIPEHLAYKGRPGAPAGMLVFDVELLAIDP